MPYSDIEAKPIQELCKIIDCEHKTAPYVEKSDFLVVRTSNVRDGQLLMTDMKYTTPDGYHEWTQRAVPEYGDVLFTREAPAGESCLVPENQKMCMGQRMVMLRPDKKKVDSVFLSLVLATAKSKSDISRLSIGSTVSRINIADIKKLRVPAPPLPEQRKIAQILSTWDKAITTTEQLLANSQQQKKALMQQLLTGKKRLLDENGVRFSGEWNSGKLSDIAIIDSGYAFKSDDFTESVCGVPVIRMSDFKSGGIDISGAAKVVVEATGGLDKFKLRAGDFIFGMSGSLSNYGWVKENDIPCYLNQRVGRILAKECSVQLFVSYLFLSDKIQKLIIDKAAGAAQLNISVSDLRATNIQYPSYQEQHRIANVLVTAENHIAAIQQKLEALKQEKKALMQQLLTGKRRVKVDEEAA